MLHIPAPRWSNEEGRLVRLPTTPGLRYGFLVRAVEVPAEDRAEVLRQDVLLAREEELGGNLRQLQKTLSIDLSEKCRKRVAVVQGPPDSGQADWSRELVCQRQGGCLPKEMQIVYQAVERSAPRNVFIR